MPATAPQPTGTPRLAKRAWPGGVTTSNKQAATTAFLNRKRRTPQQVINDLTPTAEQGSTPPAWMQRLSETVERGDEFWA